MGKLSKVRTRKRGNSYSYIFEAGKKEDGKRKVIEHGGFSSPDDAYNAGVSAYNDWKHGNIGIQSEKICLKEFMSVWMKSVVSLNVRPSTYELYSRVIDKRITPYIGEIPVQEIRPAVLDGLMRRLATTGLSRNSILSAKRLLGQSLDYAVYPSELIAENPAKYISIPKSAPHDIIKRTIITKEQYENLIKLHPFGSLSYIPINLLYHTGMRIGEVLGLFWDDIDLKKGEISVSRQYTFIKGKGNVFTQPKTASSIRKILIDDNMVSLLRRWKVQQNEWELAAGDSYCIVDEHPDHTAVMYSKCLSTAETNRKMIVCSGPSGKLVSRATIMQHLRNFGLNAHSFRHTHATVLIEAGASPKGVAGRLGHKRVDITENIYTHNTQKMQADTAEIFAKTLQTNAQCRQNADKS